MPGRADAFPVLRLDLGGVRAGLCAMGSLGPDGPAKNVEKKGEKVKPKRHGSPEGEDRAHFFFDDFLPFFFDVFFDVFFAFFMAIVGWSPPAQ
jgi:hypothetical protein